MRKNSKRRKQRALMALGEAIRNRRLVLELSQEELGARATLHRTYITDIENGLRNMSVLTLIRVSAALEVRLSELIIETENLDGWEL